MKKFSFVVLEIYLGKVGQFNLEAFYCSAGDDGWEKNHAEFKDTEFQSLTGACSSYVGIKTITWLSHKWPTNVHALIIFF